MEFVSKAIDLTLDLVSKTKEKKTFILKEEISVNFADKIIKEMNKYSAGQKTLNESEQDRMYLANLKVLSWMYKDFDVTWTKANFSINEITQIRDWALQGLTGIKEEGES